MYATRCLRPRLSHSSESASRQSSELLVGGYRFDEVRALRQHGFGQLLTRLNREDDARQVYRTGIAAATKKGDRHAAEEMTAFLDGLE